MRVEAQADQVGFNAECLVHVVLEDRPVHGGQLIELGKKGIVDKSGQPKQGRLALHKQLMVGLLEALKGLVGAEEPVKLVLASENVLEVATQRDSHQVGQFLPVDVQAQTERGAINIGDRAFY